MTSLYIETGSGCSVHSDWEGVHKSSGLTVRPYRNILEGTQTRDMERRVLITDKTYRAFIGFCGFYLGTYLPSLLFPSTETHNAVYHCNTLLFPP